MRLFDYDDSSIESIYKYAKRLEGMTFNEILQEYEKSPIKSYKEHRYGSQQTSGMVVKAGKSEYRTGAAFNKKSKGND